MARVLIGYEGTLNVGGTMSDVRDVTINEEGTEVDVTRRASNGRKETAVGHLDTTVEFDVLVTDSGSDYSALRTAWSARTPVSVNASGVTFTGVITSVSRSEPLDDAIVASVTVKQTTPGS